MIVLLSLPTPTGKLLGVRGLSGYEGGFIHRTRASRFQDMLTRERREGRCCRALGVSGLMLRIIISVRI